MVTPARATVHWKGNDAIRLLVVEAGETGTDLRCRLIQSYIHAESGNESIDFEAVSYTWGSRERQHMLRIRHNNFEKEVKVTANCLAALQRLRYTQKDRTIWIDAICISQDDVLEKNTQVAMMGRIYEHASRVLVYLGEEADNSGAVMDLIESMPEPKRSRTIDRIIAESSTREMTAETKEQQVSDVGNESTVGPSLQSLLALPGSRWLSRLWVLQEITNAKNATVVCGNRSVKWQKLRSFYAMVSQKEALKGLYKTPAALFIRKVWNAEHLPKVLHASRHCGAQDHRDKVFAPLGLFHSSAELNCPIDYSKSVQDIYREMAQYCISHFGRLDVLSAVQDASVYTNLPSWVPDWSRASSRQVLGDLQNLTMPDRREKTRSLHKFSLSESAERDIKVLTTRGVKLGNIEKLGEAFDKSSSPRSDLLHKWTDLALSHNRYGDQQARQTALAYTLCAAETIFPRAAPNPSRMLTRYTIWSYHWPSLAARGYDDVGTLNGWDRVDSSRLSPRMRSARDYDNIVRDVCHERRLLVTDNGMIGLAPMEAQVGDLVCSFLGASVPFVLRKLSASSDVGDRYRLVGECYVFGSMAEEQLEKSGESDEGRNAVVNIFGDKADFEGFALV